MVNGPVESSRDGTYFYFSDVIEGQVGVFFFFDCEPPMFFYFPFLCSFCAPYSVLVFFQLASIYVHDITFTFCVYNYLSSPVILTFLCQEYGIVLNLTSRIRSDHLPSVDVIGF